MKGKKNKPSLPFKDKETLRLPIAETVWPVNSPLRMYSSVTELSIALPTRHKQDQPPVWQVAAAPDWDAEQWDKHRSRALWVTEIPSAFDLFLVPVGRVGSDTLLLT